MRLDLYPLRTADARVRMAGDGADAAGDLDVGAERDDVVAVRRVGRDRERAVPVLAVQVLGVDALDALPGAEALTALT